MFRTAKFPVVLGSLSNFVPEGTKIVLKSRKSITYVKFGKRLQSVDLLPVRAVRARELASDVDQVGE